MIFFSDPSRHLHLTKARIQWASSKHRRACETCTTKMCSREPRVCGRKPRHTPTLSVAPISTRTTPLLAPNDSADNTITVGRQRATYRTLTVTLSRNLLRSSRPMPCCLRDQMCKVVFCRVRLSPLGYKTPCRAYKNWVPV